MFPRTGGISDKQKKLTALPMGFFDRNETKPHSASVTIKMANMTANASLIIS
jgi:hypothetical protein